MYYDQSLVVWLCIKLYNMQGYIEESTVREAVSRLFLVRMKLGEFDPPEMNPYKKYVLYHRTDCNENHKHSFVPRLLQVSMLH